MLSRWTSTAGTWRDVLRWLFGALIIIGIVTSLIVCAQTRWFEECKNLPTWAEIASLIGAGIGGVFALFQWGRSINEKKAEFFDSLLQRFISEDVQDFLRIALDSDVCEEWFSKSYGTNKDFQQKANAVFAFISQLCYLKNHGLIGQEEFAFFKDEIDELLNHRETVCFLFSYVMREHESRGVNPYVSLIMYGKRVGLDNDLYRLSEDDGAYTEIAYKRISDILDSSREGMISSTPMSTPSFCDRKEGELIGEYVRRVLFEIVRRLPKKEIAELMEKKYCKEVFGLSYPMLKESAEASTPVWHVHYYVQIIEVCGMSLRVVNEWKKSHFDRLETWCKEHASLLLEER